MDKLTYRGYTAKVEYDAVEEELVGTVEDVNWLLVFSTKNPADVKTEFHKTIDDYLEYCKQKGLTPEKAIPAPLISGSSLSSIENSIL